jgi:hypothetical protein
MRVCGTLPRIVLAVVAVGSVFLTMPSAQAANGGSPPSASSGAGVLAAPVGKRCGAYRTASTVFSDLRYWHCGGSVIRVRVDYVAQPDRDVCIAPWADVYLEQVYVADNAWYTGLCDHALGDFDQPVSSGSHASLSLFHPLVSLGDAVVLEYSDGFAEVPGLAGAAA